MCDPQLKLSAMFRQVHFLHVRPSEAPSYKLVISPLTIDISPIYKP